MRLVLLVANGLIIVAGLGLGAVAVSSHRWLWAGALGLLVVVATMMFFHERDRPAREEASRACAAQLRAREIRELLDEADGAETTAIRMLRQRHRKLTLTDAAAAVRGQTSTAHSRRSRGTARGEETSHR